MPGEAQLDVRLAHERAREVATRDQLLRIVSSHDVSRWIFTRCVFIDQSAIPHSHPVLTLHTRHLSDDDLLLSTFLHEQIHWFVWMQSAAAASAMQEFRARYPALPHEPPDGAADHHSTYLHVAVNYLELVAMEDVAGDHRARAVFDFWVTDHYRAIYRLVLDERAAIAAIVERQRLLPGR